MVVEVNTHVIEQGKQLEKVEEHIDITKENVQKAEKEIATANVISKKTFRTKLKFFFFLILKKKIIKIGSKFAFCLLLLL
jgi:ribosomal protein S25